MQCGAACCRALQYVAVLIVRCSALKVLQRTAACRIVLQFAAVCCSALQSLCCSALQCVAVRCRCCSVLQRVALNYSPTQCAVVRYTQCIAVYYSVLQRVAGLTSAAARAACLRTDKSGSISEQLQSKARVEKSDPIVSAPHSVCRNA